MVQVVERLHSMYEALGSVPSTEEKESETGRDPGELPLCQALVYTFLFHTTHPPSLPVKLVLLPSWFKDEQVPGKHRQTASHRGQLRQGHSCPPWEASLMRLAPAHVCPTTGASSS